jgi:hypothetical protein
MSNPQKTMVYCTNWEEFFDLSTKLYLERPTEVGWLLCACVFSLFVCLVLAVWSWRTCGKEPVPAVLASRRALFQYQLDCVVFLLSQTRYSFKYRPADQQIVLKVTDDRVVRVPPLNVWTKVLRGEVGVTGESCMCVFARGYGCGQIYKFKTDQANELKYVERLNQAFFRLMSSSHPTVDLVAPPGMDGCLRRPPPSPITFDTHATNL